MTALLLAAVLAAGDLEDEHAELQARLEAERAAFDAVGQEKKSLLSLLDTLERLARESASRAGELERAHARLKRQVEEARKDAAQVQLAVRAQEQRLGPRLLALYRLGRQDRLGFLLASADFSTLLKRQRALHTLVEGDARALEELSLVAHYERLQQRRLERLDETALRYVKALQQEQAIGHARLERFQDLLGTVNAEHSRRSRLVAELEAAEKSLATMVSELAPASASQGFRAHKGQLPMPTKGLVEVGFGKVVNPRFNTVTVQKGLDIRAAAGTPVVAVGQGTVAFAGWLKGYGNLVIVDHGGGYHSLYAHLGELAVEVGAEVAAGAELGPVGDTGSLKGAYLYFEIRRQGQATDPLPWLTPE